MGTSDQLTEAVEALQQLGLKEYEARCFVGLTRLDTGTAKELSEMTEVPRTRIYDAIRVLEAHGLVEIQHSSPQRFRAVSLSEATETLRDQHEDWVNRLRNALEDVEIVETPDDDPVHQVWALNGRNAIENRTNQLLKGAQDEIVLVIGEESLVTPDLLAILGAVDEEVDLIIGALTDPVQERISSEVPRATTFVSGLEWLRPDTAHDDEPGIGRLLLIDRSTILVSSILRDTPEERAIFGTGFGNGMVVIARRGLAHGLLEARDPGA